MALSEELGQQLLKLGRWVFISHSQGRLAALLGLVVGYHSLDMRPPEVMQGHHVSGMEEVKASCASIKRGEKLATLSPSRGCYIIYFS